MKRARTAAEMIGAMSPALQPGEFVFVTLGGGAAPEGAVATYREAEGLSAILPVEVARRGGLPIDQPMRCITLMVLSALDGVGLTAAVAGALAAAGIPCNMVAAYHHDHAYVPADAAEKALGVLRALQASRP
ncbi:MAG: ACT domain-containing protein [Albidovulum sp.]|uniref:ACT domain-containing protein n=1 Tax=Albidovulum sp. TaxID=1872424 RepID=UPI00132432CE|nr:ACT domain-containing protein [Defluviimonas sp.]KAB2881721.1 MAG: ACT domain-containing protein [Defluviimonas sp.]